jgi:16S rRNA (uracil1498-N3)-methyltransferase
MGDDGVRAMSHPPRFALTRPISPDGTAVIEGAELHHLRDVMRLREGAEISLLGVDGAHSIGRVETLGAERAVVRIVSRAAAEETAPLVLAVAIVKGPRMDFVVEKAAELGATELWPLMCARSVVRAPGAERIGRWRRLAMAAAKQSLAPAVMRVSDPLPFVDLIGAAAKDRLAVGALKMICTMGAEPMGSVIRRERPRAMLIACGPEGDFDRDEIRAASAAGFVAAGLGRNRLRSETAAIAAVGVAAAILDELRGGY